MSLKTFLQNRNNANTYEMAVELMQKILETVVEFERGLCIFIREKKIPLAREIMKRLDKLENEADIIRRETLMHIAKSELTPQMREDMSHLIKRIDRIANTSDGAARRLCGIDPDYFLSLGEPILTMMVDIVQLSVEGTKILFNLIKRLPMMENSETLRICEKIQDIEHKCDVLHSQIYERLNHVENLPFNHFVAIQICSFIDMLETISDKVEDVSDYIEVLKTAKRST